TVLPKFNIDLVVALLRQENAKDICVIQLSPEIKYCDYFIIVSGFSTRHLHAMANYMLKMYKHLKEEGGPNTQIEGKETDDWLCIDFGNIVVHFMLPEAREVYELEKLWTLGPYDDQLAQMTPQSLPKDFIFGLTPNSIPTKQTSTEHQQAEHIITQKREYALEISQLERQTVSQVLTASAQQPVPKSLQQAAPGASTGCWMIVQLQEQNEQQAESDHLSHVVLPELGDAAPARASLLPWAPAHILAAGQHEYYPGLHCHAGYLEEALARHTTGAECASTHQHRVLVPSSAASQLVVPQLRQQRQKVWS
ncbi:Mitochondrial assembly of ribosomal large subunit protein 1, partial [Lamprotornis superbus]